jgi:hypothetical protein
MGAPFRSDLHAAMARVEALERENARLRVALASSNKSTSNKFNTFARRPRTPRRGMHAGPRAHPASTSAGALEWLALLTLGFALLAHLAATSIFYTPPDTGSYIVFAAARGSLTPATPQ